MKTIYDPATQRVPIKAWLEDLEPGALEQALNLARLPFAAHYVALMPDCHQGYGMPVGGVLAARDHVIPNAVGVDIGCFSGDTLVSMVDGRTYRIDELAGRSAHGEALYVWACTPSGKVVAAPAAAQRTRVDAPLVEVVLDNGEAIHCTPDHPFMLRDGAYCQAQSLAPGTSLMPLYTSRDKDGYALVQQNYSGRWQKAHWVVARSGLLGAVPRVPGQRTVVHHRNFDEADNWPANLLRYLATRPDHFRAAVAGNGQRGKPYLVAYNTSERGRAKSKEIASRLYTCEVCGEQARSGFGIHNHRRTRHGYNHAVVSVQSLAQRQDVYCLTVPELHNFALAAGVFVHNCGMQARRTNVRARALAARHPAQGTVLKAVLNGIQRDVPSGNGPIGSHRTSQTWDEATQDPQVMALVAAAPDVLKQAWERGANQLGTLGGGNHFLEVQADDDDNVWIMLHSGSRALGKQVCDHFNAVARATSGPAASQTHLASLPVESDAGQQYLAWMRLCMRYAEENLRRMLAIALERLFDAVAVNNPEKDLEVTESVDTHHNYASAERHFGEDVLVHRKGSVHARAGALVVIPGSMETGSYVGRGLGSPESFESCSHGAGRRLSRTAALKARTSESVMNALRKHGIELAKRSHKDVAEEAGHAYKDIEAIMRFQVDLVVPVYRLRPLGVVKG